MGKYVLVGWQKSTPGISTLKFKNLLVAYEIGGGGVHNPEIGRGGGGSANVKRVGARRGGRSENFSCPPLPTFFNGIALMNS